MRNERLNIICKGCLNTVEDREVSARIFLKVPSGYSPVETERSPGKPESEWSVIGFEPADHFEFSVTHSVLIYGMKIGSKKCLFPRYWRVAGH